MQEGGELRRSNHIDLERSLHYRGDNYQAGLEGLDIISFKKDSGRDILKSYG